jgi:hypothetical protein
MAKDEARQGSLRTSAEAAAVVPMIMSDAAEAIRVMADQLQHQLVA